MPYLEERDDQWRPRFVEKDGWRIEYFRPRVERTYERIERWVRIADDRAHWVVRGRDGVVSVYGRRDDGSSRIADPGDATRTFRWLLEAQYHPKGSAILYEYKPEDATDVDDDAPYEAHRFGGRGGFAQRYLKRVRYGNSRPVAFNAPVPADTQWRFEVVLDYGEHAEEPAQAYEESRPWSVRPDAFSNHRAGFEVRTYRRCRRVMMFHRFDALGDSPCLVASTVLEHDDDPAGAMLKRVLHRGYRRADDGSFEEAQTPALVIDYARAAVDEAFAHAPEETSVNVPAGVDGYGCRFFDLFGEGLPGLLMRRGGAWYYKENMGGGRFGPLRELDELPARLSAALALQDFNGDGDPDLMTFAGREAGRYTRDRQKERWQPYKTFASSVRADYANARPIWADLNGDGYSDLIIDRHDRFVWYASRNGDEFDEPVELAKPDVADGGLPTLRRDGRRFFFADMSGDGLPDMVRVDNGRVQYWPNQGRGQFGRAVLMGASPRFDSDDAFEPGRLHFVDLDRSGAADLMYLGRGELRWWRNLAGNSFDVGHTVGGLPYIDAGAAVQLVDFLGDGGRCLVWSSPLPMDEGRAISYLRLSGQTPARTLRSIDNSCGRQTRLVHRHSSVDYLRDKQDGRGWHTKLPRHGAVVGDIETVDHIGDTRRKTLYRYRDGRWDAEDRRFRGFGQVDALDLVPDAEDAPTAPMMWRTWNHVGAFDDFDTRADEFFDADAAQMRLSPPRCVAGSAWTNAEHEDALRAVAGTTWRQEYYEVGDDGPAEVPLRVVEYAYEIERRQPSDEEHEAVFAPAQTDTLVHEYEGQTDDPRVSHQVQLKADAYGNVTRHLSLAYPRRDAPDRLDAQARLHAELTRTNHINFDDDARYEIGVEVERLRYELLGLDFDGGRLDIDALRAQIDEALDAPLPYDAEATDADVEARLLAWTRNHFWNDTRAEPSPAGQVGELTLLHHVEQAVFPEALVAEVFGGRVDDARLIDADLERHDGYWWAPQTTYHYRGANSFSRLAREERPDGGQRRVWFDDDWLVVTASEDSLGNHVVAELDFHRIAARRITDANDNIEEVRYDPMGMIVARSRHGTRLGADGAEHPFGDVPLEQWEAPAGMTFADFASDPAALLGEATSCSCYDLGAFERGEGPPRLLSIMREEHVHDGEGAGADDARLDATITYLDGFGRVVQTKTEAGPGEAIRRDARGEVVVVDGQVEHAPAARRWLTSGHAVYDDKGLLLRRYEPFFSTSPDFEADAALKAYGVAAEFSYDASGREVGRSKPDGTSTRVAYAAWSVTSWDANDAIIGSDWAAERRALAADDPRRKALDAALAHADTPTTAHVDAAGRTVRTVETDQGGNDRVTITDHDLRGLPVDVIDPRGVTTLSYRYDMLGRLLHEHSADAGDKWLLRDAAGRTVDRWDGRGTHVHQDFDDIGRLREATIDEDGVDEGGGPRVVRRNVYGEATGLPDAEVRARNLRGRVFEVFDDAGTLAIERYDHTGSPLTKRRLLRADYDAPVDWTDADSVDLHPEGHISQAGYDALGRPREKQLADGTTHRYEYGQLGEVRRVTVSTEDGVLRDETFLEDAVYNARGQRTLARLGNGVVLRHDFDDRSLRLSRLRVERPGEASTRRYMDVAYTYDPVGNITRWVDRRQEPTAGATALVQGASITSAREFTYDAHYQLVRATGRVHGALQQHDYRHSAPGSARMKSTRHLSLNNGAVMERYTRTYAYDLAGNLKSIRHQAASRSWKTELWTAPDSNRSAAKHDIDGVEIANPESFFDENGNMVRLPHLDGLEWDWANRLCRAVVIERTGERDDDAEYYVYGADGRRVRKVTKRAIQGGVEVTDVVYLDGCEIREVRRGSVIRLRRRTCHVSDGSSRIATVHQWDVDDRGAETDDLNQKRIHYRVDNHMGSVSLELDATGDVISYEEYFAFGGTSFIAGDSARDVKLKEYRYSGKLRDDTTGLYYYEYRYYAPFIGNWISPDPAGPVDGLNLYRFVRNNPIRFVDPNGLRSDDIHVVGSVESGLSEEEAIAQFNRTRGIELGIIVTDMERANETTWLITKFRDDRRRRQEMIDRAGGDEEFGEALYTLTRVTEQMDAASRLDEAIDSAGGGGEGDSGEGNAAGETGDGDDPDAADPGPGSSESSGDGQDEGGAGQDEATDGANKASSDKGAENGASNAPKSDDDSVSGNGDTTEGVAEGSADGSTTAGGGASGNAPDGAQNLAPVPLGLPTGNTGIPYSPDIDPDLIREGAGAGNPHADPRGTPGADGGSGQRPGGQQGGRPNDSAGGGQNGSPGSSPGGNGSRPAHGKRGIKGGLGDEELPEWLSWVDPALDGLQLGLDVVGLIPGFGEIADGLNGLVSLARGDYVGAGLSFAAMIPFAGWGATAGKIGRKAVNAADALGDTTRAVTRYGDEAATSTSGRSALADQARRRVALDTNAIMYLDNPQVADQVSATLRDTDELIVTRQVVDELTSHAFGGPAGQLRRLEDLGVSIVDERVPGVEVAASASGRMIDIASGKTDNLGDGLVIAEAVGVRADALLTFDAQTLGAAFPSGRRVIPKTFGESLDIRVLQHP